MIKKILSTSLLVFLMVPSVFANGPVKRPNVAGQFYDASPARLTKMIDDMMAAATVSPTDKAVEILISPHAGYVYSGPVAAYGYKAVSSRPIKTVVVLAPSHYFGFDGVAVWPKGSFQTPLGELPVDEAFASALLAKNKKFIAESRAFDREHSLEVQLPFLQRTFNDIKVVPVIMGQDSFELCQALAQALDEIIGTRPDVLVVASSDMSHFHEAKVARKMDEAAIARIKNMDIEGFWQGCGQRQEMEMCGWMPVTVALILAQRRGLALEFLHYAHSGDVTGDNTSVVGYTSIMFYHPTKQVNPAAGAGGKKMQNDGGGLGVAPLTVAQKKRLLAIASQTIHEFVNVKKVLDVTEADPRLNESEGAFVTIHKNGQLRGCIGHIIGTQPLYKTVRDMAVAAASEDPRFSPVTPGELPQIDIEISVLSKPRQARSVDEIQLGVHGVIVSRGRAHQGLFLPQVATETGWTREQFLSELCRQKAGLPATCWQDPATRLDIFTADVFSEKELQ